jgi:predicted hydrocarbon binding protein
MNAAPQSNRLVRLPAAAIAAVHRAVIENRDPVEAVELLRLIGLEAGEAYHDLLRNWLAEEGADSSEPGELGAEEFWQRLSDFLDALGLGTVRYEQLHSGVFAITSQDWVEAETRDPGHPGCQLTTGLLAELLRRVAGQDLAILEVECRGTGGEMCRFLAGSPAALDHVFGEMERGAAYAEAVGSLA